MTTLAKCTPVEIDPSYDKFIQELALNSDDLTFTNSSEVHALSILRATFMYSKHYVYMFSNKLDACVFNDQELISEAKNFLREGNHKLHIAIQDDTFTPERCEFSKQLLTEFPNSVEIKKAEKDSKVSKIDINFTVADDKAYRLENDIAKKTATGSFDDKETSSILKSLFDKIFQNDSMCAVNL